MSRKILEGIVLKKSSDKTISVEVKRKYLHKTLHKSVTSSRKYLVHDQDNCATIGENVKIIESRPISKRKRWSLLKSASS